jgi:DNA repair exonuclease SbcCD ATPase subunit
MQTLIKAEVARESRHRIAQLSKELKERDDAVQHEHSKYTQCLLTNQIMSTQLAAAQRQLHHAEEKVKRDTSAMDALRKKMQQSVEESGAEREQLMKKLQQVEQKLSKAEQELSKAGTDTCLCRVCEVRPLERVFDCGHTICGECDNRLKSKTCPVCRAPILSRKRIFI